MSESLTQRRALPVLQDSEAQAELQPDPDASQHENPDAAQGANPVAGHDPDLERLLQSPSVHQQLADIAEPAILLSRDYRVAAANRAYRARYGEFGGPKRQYCFQVSHGYKTACDQNGENCPMQEVIRSGQRSRVFHVHQSPAGLEHVDVDMRPVHDEHGELSGFIERIRPLQTASAESYGAFVGRSQPFLDLLGLIHRVAPSLVPVLLLGESGTGKELAARAVHEASERASGPFVPVECSGLSAGLFESELFGHRRGAFTGAHADKAGLVEAAAGGTLFLDEIGDVPPALQVKLLRLLESGLYRRVGDPTPHRANFRLICATHQDLGAAVTRGEFRKDLFYRISAFPITLPPLRERKADLPLLCEMLLRATGAHKQVGANALRVLAAYDFPGNIRELRNLLERAVLLADGDELKPQHFLLPDSPDLAQPHVAPPTASTAAWPWGDTVLPLAEVEARYLTWANQQQPTDRTALAQQLGISDRTLYRKLAQAQQLLNAKKD